VIVERDILRQIRSLQAQLGFAVLFITHDLARMLQFSDRVAVFYAARLVELGPSAQVGHAARHPYTRGLLRAFPRVHGTMTDAVSIPGAPPSLIHPPTWLPLPSALRAGDSFVPRTHSRLDRGRARALRRLSGDEVGGLPQMAKRSGRSGTPTRCPSRYCPDRQVAIRMGVRA
jgi:oligopeptide/dipeptide ABC transporter ATP-binding protein